ncbi:unnamed protein product [Cyprideis torosa]|uniref:Signal transducer and activator of transcription n=1 Tax=Cyprideis torosa TaxID=163714 RepID=A0A7R8ZI85_9CRUS|nr:unnamed protein product [Cyprideis torosa]CAG0884262.1 unnamed protein product [Cyprideis torosa]
MDLYSGEFEILNHRTQETQEDLRSLELEQEQFSLQYHEFINCQNRLQVIQQQNPSPVDAIQRLTQQNKLQQERITSTVNKLVQNRTTLISKFKETIILLQQVQTSVLDRDLIGWKKKQQLAGSDNFDNNLDQIQEWCEILADIIWRNRQQLKSLAYLREKAPFHNDGHAEMQSLVELITSLLSSLVTGTFIIEKQPPQVLKTNTRFQAVVRLLVGAKLNVNMTPPQVKVSIINEAQALQLLRSDLNDGASGVGRPKETSGDIINNTGTMEYSQPTRQLSVNFRNMQLKKIKRAEKRGSESVMDEKFSLLFQTQFNVGSGELEFFVWTLSLPAVVIVHVNQEPHAWATVSWDNAFSETGRNPFVVPDRVVWPRVAEMLNTRFTAGCSQSLTDENLHFLAGKAFRNPSLHDYSQQELSWSQFCKEPLPDRPFTFWEWFYGIMKLTREHLRNLWNEGFIIGFVAKKQAESYLRSKPIGTFLLRFSDSELGGISLAAHREGGIEHLAPFSSKDFAIRSLADRISDLDYLTHLYPSIDKHAAFGRYYTPRGPQTRPDGYVRPEIRTYVPDAMSSAAQSPASIYDHHSGPGSVGSMSQHSHDPGNAYMGAGEEQIDWDQFADIEVNEEDIMNFIPFDLPAFSK